MKKIISIILIISVLSMIIFTGRAYAAELDAIDIQTDKTTVRPGEDVKVTINFGQELGRYTINVAYDNNIFEYKTVEGGEASDTTDKVEVSYNNTEGATNASASVTFTAKTGITTSNPTEFTITAENLANADASVEYDDITTPIVKNVTVEPEYVNYTLSLEKTGDIVKGQEIPMKLSYSSTMGRHYEHARLIAEATTPEGANVKLLATDVARLEHDIIQSGWGDAQGYAIGGQNFSQELDVTGIFSEAGDYAITLKLIDRDNSDTVIAENTIQFTATAGTTPPVTNPDDTGTTTPPTNPPTNNPDNAGEVNPPVNTENTETTVKEENVPTKLPKTGNNIYIPVIGILVALIGSFVYNNKIR